MAVDIEKLLPIGTIVAGEGAEKSLPSDPPGPCGIHCPVRRPGIRGGIPPNGRPGRKTMGPGRRTAGECTLVTAR